MNIEKLNALVAPKYISRYYELAVEGRTPYFGENKFPNRKQTGIRLDSIHGRKKSPVKLSVSAFDAQALKLKRGGFEIKQTLMPYFKNILPVDEELKQQLLIMDESNTAAVQQVLRLIYDDKASLISDAAVTREILRMQALTTGVISISDNGQSYSFDYDVPVDHKVTPRNKWDTESADPIGDLNKWVRKIKADTGVRVAEMLIEQNTLAALANNKAIRNAVYVFGQGLVAPSNAEIGEFIRRQTGLTVYAYDEGYRNEKDEFVPFVPKGTVVLMPSTPLGDSVFGTTPEEASFTNGKYDLSIVDLGVALSSATSFDPVNTNTKCSMVFLPSFEASDQVIIADVLTK